MGATVETAVRAHLTLPETDGLPMQNFIQAAQIALLSFAFKPVLRAIFPDGQYCVGRDSGIYFRRTDPPLAGCRAPDWFLVTGVTPQLDGVLRRSYVLWEESVEPLLVVEFVSGDGSEERDRTPHTGKFWVYEHDIRSRYYAIFDYASGDLEVFELVDGSYRAVEANARGHFPIPELDIELGVWQGQFLEFTELWLRCYDRRGKLVPIDGEVAAKQRRRADRETRNAERERRNAERERLAKQAVEADRDRLAAQLRALGVDPAQP